MKSLLYYLLQVTVASGILYGYYHLALRNKKFHHYNRFYLLAATFISITIPFLNIPVYFSPSETNSSFVLQTLTVISSDVGEVPTAIPISETHINWLSWKNLSLLFYILIASFVLVRIIFSLIKIRRIIKTNPVEQLDRILFINTSEPGTPFSFFRWLFWNKKIELQSEKGEQIFRHELFHIKQKHSWDIMYLELLTVLLWINPFFHLVKKEVKAIHEFLADQFAITENRKWEYAELLLMQVLNTKQQLVNPFFHNQIKRRIAMITTSKKPSYQYLRKLIVLPVAAIVILLFAFSYKERKSDKIDLPEIISESIADTTRPLSIDNKIYDKVDIEASFPGGEVAWKEYLNKNADGTVPLNNKAPKGQYTVVIQFIVSKDGNISDIKPLTKHRYGMEQEAIKVIRKTPKWNPAVKDGKMVTAYKKQPITFSLIDENFKPDSSVTSKYLLVPPPSITLAQWSKSIVVIDGKIQEGLKVSDIDKHLSIGDIQSFNILKGPSAIFNYGDRGKNGVTEIVTKKGDLKEMLIIEKNIIVSDNKVFSEVETDPSFPGGTVKWKQYLKAVLNQNIPAKKGAPVGTYTVIVQFIVKTDSFLTNIKSLTNHGFGMEEEAVRIISKGPRWIPAIQNGRQVNAIRKQPVTFLVTEQSSKLITEAQSQKTGNGTPQIPEISLDKLRKATPIQLLQLPEGTEIVSYKFTIDLNDDSIIEVPNTGSSFSPATKNQFNKATAGKLITFDLITIKENGQEKRIPSKVYAVTN